MSYLFTQLTTSEQRAVLLVEHQKQQALIAAIIADCQPVTPEESGTPEGRAALENFIQRMNEKRESKPNPLLVKVQP